MGIASLNSQGTVLVKFFSSDVAEQGESGLVDVVVDEDDGLPGLLDEVGDLHNTRCQGRCIIT